MLTKKSGPIKVEKATANTGLVAVQIRLLRAQKRGTFTSTGVIGGGSRGCRVSACFGKHLRGRSSTRLREMTSPHRVTNSQQTQLLKLYRRVRRTVTRSAEITRSHRG